MLKDQQLPHLITRYHQQLPSSIVIIDAYMEDANRGEIYLIIFIVNENKETRGSYPIISMDLYSVFH